MDNLLEKCDTPESIEEKLNDTLTPEQTQQVLDLMDEFNEDEKTGGGGKVTPRHVFLLFLAISGITWCGLNSGDMSIYNYILHLKSTLSTSFLSAIGLMLTTTPGPIKVTALETVSGYDLLGKANLLHGISSKLLDWISLLKKKGKDSNIEDILPAPIYKLLSILVSDDSSDKKTKDADKFVEEVQEGKVNIPNVIEDDTFQDASDHSNVDYENDVFRVINNRTIEILKPTELSFKSVSGGKKSKRSKNAKKGSKRSRKVQKRK
jgi:hypothetical protein